MGALVAVLVVVGLLVVVLVVVLVRVMARLNAAPVAAPPQQCRGAGMRRRSAKPMRCGAPPRRRPPRSGTRPSSPPTRSRATRGAVAEQEVHSLKEEARALKDEMHELKADLERREHRLAEREERLDAEQRRVEARDRELAEHEAGARATGAPSSPTSRRSASAMLERVAGLTAADAKAELVKTIENQAKREAALIVRDIEHEAREEGEKRARKIVTLAIQRVATEQTAESVVSVLHLPSDDMKGRIIGREGRNIRAFESVTGVNLIIDDTPEAVLLSCFDPVRREVGRLTLEKLVLDGRIHPQRIEEVYERSKAEVEQLCVRAGEDAMVEVGITDMHPELITLLGQLRYRTSYGQNVLKHLVESAHIAGMMASRAAARPGADASGARVLHDIGKALTHEVEGSHAHHRRRDRAQVRRARGRRARHRGAPQRGRGAHRRGGAHPGRRRDQRRPARAPAASRWRPTSSGSSASRRSRSEQPGVEKVFAMQAGREIRVMVQAGRGRRHRGAGDRARRREADRGGADLPRPDPHHRRPRVARHGVREVMEYAK